MSGLGGMLMIFKVGGLFLISAMACSGAMAADNSSEKIATVSDLSGKVLVSAGSGFAPALQNVVLKPGDRVLVGNNSFATLSFKTCDVALTEPTVFTVSDVAPCDAAVIQPVADLPGGGAYPPGGAGVPPVAAAPVIPPIITTLAFVGPVAIGCAVKCGDLLDNEETPTSAD